MTLIRVALDVPVDRLFDYRCGDRNARIGTRVLVPFGRRRLIGIVVAKPEHSEVPEASLKHAIRVLDEQPLLGKADLRLLEFAAGYYVHPLGAAIMMAVPATLRRVRLRDQAPAAYALTPAGAAIDAATLPPRARASHRLLALLQSAPVVDHAAVAALGAATRKALQTFLEKGWVRTTIPDPVLAQDAPAAAAGPPLNPEQAAALQAVASALGRFQPMLLLGITGSGKTEVYLHAIAATLARNAQALLLVPEIALTPQLQSLIVARFPGTPVATLHSGLADGERAAHWEAARSGKARIVLGTRLAVFAPIPALGLIIVDEEHDGSFKQGEGFRYSARDLAVVRARQAGVPIILGSATPALETYRNAMDGRYQLLRISQRINARPPLIDCIDLRQGMTADGLSDRLITAIASRIERGEQSMVFINRRGYAPVLICGSCGWTSDCKRCSAKLVLHLPERRLRCHHCGHDSAVPASCPDCGNTDLAPVGQGTQRIEAALAHHFPEARILRIDRDTTRRRDAWPDMRERIREGTVDILVGTQILAKGHDFPRLNLVGIVNADSMLYSNDFRAPERLYALLSQVAGRAGRADIRGQVLVQTRFADHPLYAALRHQDFDTFAQTLLAERRQAGFPPYVHQALLRSEARSIDTALQFLAKAARTARGISPTVSVYDPVPAGMMRRAGRERAHLLVQSGSRTELRSFLKIWHQWLAETSNSATRWSLDVDPAEL
ncbi:MAG: primosomal protein N' [Burkholderiales bacterium]|nr:primosomal protein N' [Burkholderiales bacterium]MDP2399999.1 primosomal protein N' [Burkholderiales bacterium]